jgi:hypothetical protein
LKTYEGLQFLRSTWYKQRRKLISSIPSADPSLKTALQKDGYVRWDLAEFDALQDVVNLCRKVIADNHSNIEKLNQDFENDTVPDKFITNPFMDLNIDEHLTLDSPLLKFALHPSILKPVSEYLGMIPVLSGITLWYSPNKKEYPLSSQKFHIDMHDRRNAKLFLYIEEVDENSGPLTVISADDSRKIEKKLEYKMKYVFKNETGSRVEDELIEEIVGGDKSLALTGPSGTVFMADTDSCFHFGSRGATKPRYTMQFYFEPPFAFGTVYNEESYKKTFQLSHLIENTDSEIEKLVLGL